MPMGLMAVRRTLDDIDHDLRGMRKEVAWHRSRGEEEKRRR
jgi:hypothetical protein